MDEGQSKNKILRVTFEFVFVFISRTD